MTPRLPRLKGIQVVRALEKAGFQIVRVKGSHHFLRHPDGRVTTVPVHEGELIGPGLLSKILRDADLGADDLAGLL
jgi:predicted RNA binding protein YcfA (HicA-like mRNA interferase family)